MNKNDIDREEDEEEEEEEEQLEELSKTDQRLVREDQEKYLKKARSLYYLEKKIKQSSGLQKFWLSSVVKPQIESIETNEGLGRLEGFGYKIKWCVWVLVKNI